MNCTFINNNTNNGGAIRSFGNTNIENCNFINNSAGGGATYR